MEMENQEGNFPAADNITFYSGNIISWNSLKRKGVTQGPSEEVALSVNNTLARWLKNPVREATSTAKSIVISNENNNDKIPANERDSSKVTVKVFIYNTEREMIQEAVERALSDLGISQIDTVLLAMPERPYEEPLAIPHFKPVWQELESFVDSQKIKTIGVCDIMDRPMLEELYDWARLKPQINQINLDSCCVVPPEIKEYATEKNIQLLTHADPRDILPAEMFREAVAELCPLDSEDWFPSWVVRHSVLVKCRGIVRSKGYIVKAQRVLPDS